MKRVYSLPLAPLNSTRFSLTVSIRSPVAVNCIRHYIMARAMKMEVYGQLPPPCGDDCPCRQRRLLFSEEDFCDEDTEWKPCLLVRSVQGCYFNSVKVCDIARSVVKDPKGAAQEVPAKTWRFLNQLMTSEQGRRIMICLSSMFDTLNSAVGMLIPSNPPIELPDDKVLHLLISLYGIPSKSVRRVYETILNTVYALNEKYCKDNKCEPA